MCDANPAIAAVEPVPEGARVRLKTDVLVRDLTIVADRIAPRAEADAMMVTLLCGDERDVVVRGADAAEVTRALRHPVRRSANDLVRGER